MNEWTDDTFDVWSPDGPRTVTGAVSGAFGIHFDAERDPPGWLVAHIESGLFIGGEQPFKGIEVAKEFVARIRPLADWNNVDVNKPPDVTLEIDRIIEALIDGDPLSLPRMTEVPSYIGDDAFKEFLNEHDCRTSFEEIRMRLLGVMVSPGQEADIYLLVEDFFEYDMP